MMVMLSRVLFSILFCTAVCFCAGAGEETDPARIKASEQLKATISLVDMAAKGKKADFSCAEIQREIAACRRELENLENNDPWLNEDKGKELLNADWVKGDRYQSRLGMYNKNKAVFDQTVSDFTELCNAISTGDDEAFDLFRWNFKSQLIFAISAMNASVRAVAVEKWDYDIDEYYAK